MPTATLKIIRFALNVGDLDQACAFYCNALGFKRAGVLRPSEDRVLLQLGDQQLELRASKGRLYPQPRAANDPWFQHFAIAVSDMASAYQQLSRHGQESISLGGPQRLPPSTGSVTAYKFRDPDGHPLELSYIPGSPWLKDSRDAHDSPFLGIDHSAVAVRDLAASVGFYTEVLGLSDTERGFNHGPEQDRLDGLADARVDIVSLQTAQAGPHIELLHYRAPDPGAAAWIIEPDDIAATRMILRVPDALTGRQSGRLVQDPDGHHLEIVGLNSGEL